jgi:hypothetical protein
LGLVRRVVGVLLLTVVLPGLACAKSRKEGSPAQAAAWFKAVANQKPSASTTTSTTPARATTTIPPTTSTVAPLTRLALTKPFLEAADTRRLADERCRQLSGGKRRRCANPAPTTTSTVVKVKEKPKPK